MAPDSLTFLGGLLMGLASSLHCAGMCGAIASSLMFAFSPARAQWSGCVPSLRRTRGAS